MSNQGIRGFYQITNTLKDKLLEDININTVTTGDISDINLRKRGYVSYGSHHSK